MIDVLLLWHMHQPRYVHPVSGAPILPWVRLHAASSYLDMARVLERRANARVTVNFVPSLLEQLAALEKGAKDELEQIAEKDASDLDELETKTVLARSFSVRWTRVIEPRPRYAQLLAQRTTRFRTEELRDLECLFLLGWLGFAAREDDPAVDELDAKGRDYTEDDKRVLLLAVRSAATRVLPAWRALLGRGQVELSTSPYYHPIIPLLIDSDAAHRARPDDRLPSRFSFPEDAREQIRLALAAHERTFGKPARGMWPPEGALSPEAVAMYGECGIEWLSGDEETLLRSLGTAENGHSPHAHVWRYAGVDLLFRDRELSDRIGFRYSDKPAEDAVADLLAGIRSRTGDGVVGLFLDGENAWEGYEGRGRQFLDGLYAELERQDGVRTRTVSECLADRGPGTTLATLHSGSWIDAAFQIWIGDPEKNRAWSHLAQAREALARARAMGTPGTDEAHRLLLAAEGSDWFWWFGEPFSSAEDGIFDSLFRAHLAEAWRALGKEPPEPLADPIVHGLEELTRSPRRLISPRLDGRSTRYFEWQGAACYEIGRGGTMADHSHPVERIHLGFDHEWFYLRLDPVKEMLRLVTASHIRMRVRSHDKDQSLHVIAGSADGGPKLSALGGRLASLDVVELAVPFAALGLLPRDELRLWLELEFAGVVLARVPRDGVLALVVPWVGWEDEHWSA